MLYMDATKSCETDRMDYLQIVHPVNPEQIK